MSTRTDEDLLDLDEWMESKRGNRWRKYNGQTLTIFEYRNGSFGWCIADENGPRFSKTSYDTIHRALRAMRDELEEDD